jgi:hypothetical protein
MSLDNTQQADIVAHAGRYYRNTRYLMTVLTVGMGLWFAYDGWVRYPQQNQRLAELSVEIVEARKAAEDARASGDADREQTEQAQLSALLAEQGKLKHHSASDLLLQRALGMGLPPLGIAFLAWSLYRSRGAYRLSGQTLSVPGHPPIQLDQIVRIDKQLWERKGIAHVDYETPEGRQGRITLDDFIYDRQPTDAIYARIEQFVGIAPEPSQDAGQ